MVKRRRERGDDRQIGPYLHWDAPTNAVVVDADLSAEELPLVSGDQALQVRIANGLKKTFRYEGSFRIEIDDVPF